MVMVTRLQNSHYSLKIISRENAPANWYIIA